MRTPRCVTRARWLLAQDKQVPIDIIAEIESLGFSYPAIEQASCA